MQSSPASSLRAKKSVEAIVAQMEPEDFPIVRDFLSMFGDKQRLMVYFESRSRDLLEIIEGIPEYGPPLDPQKFSAQVSAVIQSVSESGNSDPSGRLKPEVVRTIETIFFIEDYICSCHEQGRAGQEGLCKLLDENTGHGDVEPVIDSEASFDVSGYQSVVTLQGLGTDHPRPPCICTLVSLTPYLKCPRIASAGPASPLHRNRTSLCTILHSSPTASPVA